MYTLGINAAYHDPAACLVQDGQVIVAVEEERFTRIKHGKRPIPFSAYELPFHAIDYCLQEAGIRLVDVEHVAYSYDPFLLLGTHRGDETIELPLEPSAHPTPEEWEASWDPLFLSSIVNAPRHLVGGVPHHLQARFRGARWDGPYRWHFVEHHVAHEASAFYPAPFQEAAILTLDGRGERATTTYAMGQGTHIQRVGQVNMPHSLGHLYERVTDYLGFLHSSDEGKIMALASYGEPTYLDDLRDIVGLGEDGQYRLQAVDLKELFGPRRLKGQPLEPRHADIAHSLQLVLEETALKLADWLHGVTGGRLRPARRGRDPDREPERRHGRAYCCQALRRPVHRTGPSRYLLPRHAKKRVAIRGGGLSPTVSRHPPAPDRPGGQARGEGKC